MLHRLRAAGFDVETRNHAAAILSADFAEATEALAGALLSFRMTARHLIQGGGGHAEPTMRLRDALVGLGWRKHVFSIRSSVDGRDQTALPHEIDHTCMASAGTIALEIEWNTKTRSLTGTSRTSGGGMPWARSRSAFWSPGARARNRR